MDLSLDEKNWGAEVDAVKSDPLKMATLKAFGMDLVGNGAQLTLALLRKQVRS